MFTTSKLYPLNAKAIKSSLKREEVKVYSCKKGTGTTKKATYIVVDVKDAKKAVSFLRNIGVVNTLGNPIKINGIITKKEGFYSLGACYMDERTFIELNE